MLDLASSICNSADETGQVDITDFLCNIYRAKIGLANATRDPISGLRNAELHFEAETKRHEKIGHPTSMLAVAYNDLGAAYSMNSLYQKAKPMLRKSQSIRENLPGFRKDWLFSPNYHLALAFHYQNKDQDAAELLASTIKDRVELLGRDDRVSVR